MGDVNKIPITGTGSTQLLASNNDFKLSDTLCAPAIKQNSISVSKFYQDNQSSIEFFPYNFYVKDLQTRIPLVHDWSKHGLYEGPPLSTPMSPQVRMFSQNVPISIWHCRLDHSYSIVLSFILNKFPLLASADDKFSFCNSCSANKAHRKPFHRLTLSRFKPL